MLRKLLWAYGGPSNVLLSFIREIIVGLWWPV
jgi:hypothetical protein